MAKKNLFLDVKHHLGWILTTIGIIVMGIVFYRIIPQKILIVSGSWLGEVVYFITLYLTIMLIDIFKHKIKLQ